MIHRQKFRYLRAQFKSKRHKDMNTRACIHSAFTKGYRYKPGIFIDRRYIDIKKNAD